MARLIQQSGGPIDYLRMIKLVYLADRESIKKIGLPIVGGTYYSMNKGPAVSEVMDFVRDRTAPGWKHSISFRLGNEIRLATESPDSDWLSPFEIEVLDSVVGEHRGRTTLELVDWCHKNCAEYREVATGRRVPIPVEDILRALGKKTAAIKNALREARVANELDAQFA